MEIYDSTLHTLNFNLISRHSGGGDRDNQSDPASNHNHRTTNNPQPMDRIKEVYIHPS